MKKVLQYSEDSSFFRNEVTTTPEQQTRRASYSVPSKKPIIKQIFEFYAKQTYAVGVNSTFDRQSYESSILTIAKFFHFCKDFNIQFLNKQELTEVFKKCATFGKQMNLQQFEQLFSLLAFYRGVNLLQFYAEIGLDHWASNQKRMRHFCKPFQMKDERERFKKEELHYQFKLFHPEVKDQQLLRDILNQRKQNHEKMKSQEREKKEIEKLQFELKFLRGSELSEKYPESYYLISKLQNRKVKQHISFFKPLKKIAYSVERASSKEQKEQQRKSPIVTWQGLENIKPNDDVLKQLIGQNIEDEYYLKEYGSLQQSQKKKPNQSQQYYGCLSSNNRSLSDQFPKQNQRSNNMLTSLHEAQEENFEENVLGGRGQMNQLLINYPERSIISYRKPEFSPVKSPNKLTLSIMKRANEIQNIEKLKEKHLIDMVLNSHKHTVQNSE